MVGEEEVVLGVVSVPEICVLCQDIYHGDGDT